MPLTIKDIKKDLKRWNVLEESYDLFEDNIKIDDRIWKCTINDYLVQVWINLKMEIDKVKAKDLLPLIPEEQAWFKKMLIKMIVGMKVYDFSAVAEALACCHKPSKQESEYLFQYYPLGHRNPQRV